jgi:hypothetical protein
MEAGKTCWGIERRGEKERQRENGLGRERDNDSGERKWHGLEEEHGAD